VNNARVSTAFSIETIAAGGAAIVAAWAAASRVARRMAEDNASRTEHGARADIVDGLRREVERYRALNNTILDEFERAQGQLLDMQRELNELRATVAELKRQLQ
jgi:hypothetical protein